MRTFPFISSTGWVFISVKVWLWVKSTASIQSLLFLGIRYACTQFRNNGILLKFIKALEELKKKSSPSFLALSRRLSSAVLSLTQPAKLEVGSCDRGTDFTQCNYQGDTRTERYKGKKRPYRLLALNTGRNPTGSQCVISRPIKPHQEQQGGKRFTSSSHSLTFVENYSN